MPEPVQRRVCDTGMLNTAGMLFIFTNTTKYPHKIPHVRVPACKHTWDSATNAHLCSITGLTNSSFPVGPLLNWGKINTGALSHGLLPCTQFMKMSTHMATLGGKNDLLQRSTGSMLFHFHSPDRCWRNHEFYIWLRICTWGGVSVPRLDKSAHLWEDRIISSYSPADSKKMAKPFSHRQWPGRFTSNHFWAVEAVRHHPGIFEMIKSTLSQVSSEEIKPASRL